MASDIKVLSWNVNGLKENYKLKTVERKTALLKIFELYDIVLLQETHIKDDDEDRKFITGAFKKYALINLEDEEKKKEEKKKKEEEEEDEEEEKDQTLYYTDSPDSKGVAIIVNKKHTLLNSFCDVGEYAWVHVQIDQQEYTFVSVYYSGVGPNVIGNLMLEIFYSFSTEGLDASKCRPVIGGDFNTTLSELDADGNIPEHTERRKTLNAFLRVMKVSDVWREKHGGRRCTYENSGIKSRIDYVFMLKDDYHNYVKSCTIPKKIDLSDLSDHYPVKLILKHSKK